MAAKNFDLIKLLTFTIPIVLIFGCGNKQKEYRLVASSSGTSYYNVGINIADIMSRANGKDIKVLSDSIDVKGKKLRLNAINNCYILSEGQADFALSQNDVSFIPHINLQRTFQYSNIRSVIPLYSEIFFIIYKEYLNPKSLRDLVVGRKVAVGPHGSGTERLTQNVFEEFGINPSEYQFQYVNFENNVLSDTIDISCLLTGFNNPRIEMSLKRGGKIFSLGNPNLEGKGSAADGFCLKYPLAKPYIIPTNIFTNLPQEPILTIAIDAVLLTREDVDAEVVYKFVETILNNKQFLVVDLNNRLLSQITEQFDPLKLRFPLHKGAKQYLERDKPSFLERYAESLGFIFSIFLAFIGGVTAFARWNRRRKKNRIDTYYKGIMNIQIQINDFNTEKECRNAIQELKLLRQNAFEHLIAEKLSADESFRIFITFVNDTQKELEQRIQAIRGRT